AVLFAGIGRHPLAGLAAAFAGVSGGYSANLLITGLDPLLAGLTEEAARSLDPSYSVNATCNYYFMVVSTFLITIVGTLVTNRIVEPMLGEWDPAKADHEIETAHDPDPAERRGFRWAMLSGLLTTGLLALLVAVPGAPLRAEVAAGEPEITALAPFFDAIEVLIALLFFVPGVVYGVLTGHVRNDKDVAKMTADTMATMGTYIVLAFVAAQFVAFFNWTNLGAVTAVKGASFLEGIGFEGVPLLLAFLVVSSLMNLFVGSASAKWAFMAPIFVPMMMYMGISPEAVQVTYRVGDSITNIITPLMPYLPIIIVFAKKYDRDAGLGTLIAAMLPYSVAFGIVWTIVLGLWVGFDLPLGPGVGVGYELGSGAGGVGTPTP
ncbi:MAG: AbgT family transporter, partial [Myxococcota bacterium]